MPPEAISERLFSEASDVWSYGVLQWELFNPYTIPYKDISNVEVSKDCIKVTCGHMNGPHNIYSVLVLFTQVYKYVHFMELMNMSIKFIKFVFDVSQLF